MAAFDGSFHLTLITGNNI